MPHTAKHNIRLGDDVWLPSVDQAEEIARLGVKGDHGPFSVADMVRRSLTPCQTETPVETMLRLGMDEELIAIGLHPHQRATS